MDRSSSLLFGFQTNADTSHSQSTAITGAGTVKGAKYEGVFPAWSYAYYAGYLVIIGTVLVISAIAVYRINAAASARRNEAEPGFGPSAGAQVKQQEYYAKPPTIANWGSPDTKWRKRKS